MTKNKYIEYFKDIIANELLLHKGDKKFVDGLFENIKEKVKKIAGYVGLPEVDDLTLYSYFEVAKNEHLSIHPIDIEISSSLKKTGLKTWINSERKIDWNYSERYFRYLEKNGRSKKVVKETIDSSLRIMEKMADPESKIEVFVKGLVVGEVQSGKTGNFNGVINRAIDSGYRLIVVLSGIMEDLRSQTQQRIENEVIGEGRNIDTQKTQPIGVGKEIVQFGNEGKKVGINVQQAISITSYNSDFTKAIKENDFSLNQINVLVCKKNVNVLKNLIIYLHDYLGENKDIHNIPLLVIDDEADNASLNNLGYSAIEEASKINGHIRALLALFSIKTYLGYTATPFANVLQDRNDTPEKEWEIIYKVNKSRQEKQLKRVDNIFPEDFIELLKSPTNYIGAKQIFETVKELNNKVGEKIPLVAPTVTDHIYNFPTKLYINKANQEIVGVKNFTRSSWDEENGQFGGYGDFVSWAKYDEETFAPKKEHIFPKRIPNSLEDAIKCFILTLAIRESRKSRMINSTLYQPHNTMLIHISRFTSWQNTTKTLIQDYIKILDERITNEKPIIKDSIYVELESTWNNHYSNIVENIRDYLPFGYEDEFMKPLVYDSLKKYLPDAVKGIEVKAINSSTKDKLEYPKHSPKKIIAIGGNRLSRGFTLEGLTINYFIRNTNYSDTLLQMGRWFGYRPGYLDCCKIFTTQNSIDKFNSTTLCIEALEIEFERMKRKDKEPRSFALRVKKHPGALKITRPSILKNSVDVKWSYEDQLEMTTEFNVSKQKIETVWESFKQNIAPKFKKGIINNFPIFKLNGEEFIELLRLENNIHHDDKANIIKFIQLCNEKKKLNTWTIALKTVGRSGYKINKEIGGFSEDISVELAVRRGPIAKEKTSDWDKFIKEKKFKATGKNANIVSSPEDFNLLLSSDQIKQARKEFIKNRTDYYFEKEKPITKEEALIMAKKVTKPERIYREKMDETEGLLVIYLFSSVHAFNEEKDRYEDKAYNDFRNYVLNEKIDTQIPLVGYAIGFPPISGNIGGEYSMQKDFKNLLNEEDNEEDVGEEEDLENIIMDFD